MKSRFCKFVVANFALAFLGISNCLPMQEVQNKSSQSRQDTDGGGEVEEIGEQVSQIINGVVTGDFGSIFSGSTGFIDDGDVSTGVGSILNGLTNPLNNLLQTSIKQGQKYYNITETPINFSGTSSTTEPGQVAVAGAANGNPIGAGGVPLKLVPANGLGGTGSGLQAGQQNLVVSGQGQTQVLTLPATSSSGGSNSNAQSLPAGWELVPQVVYVTVPAAPLTEAPTTTTPSTSDGEDEDNDNDNSSLNSLNLRAKEQQYRNEEEEDY